jgi:hypothetical protein
VSAVGDGRVHVVRIDPKVATVGARAVSERATAKENLTAAAWCRQEHWVAATNAGMYAEDFTRHVGYFNVIGVAQGSPALRP